MLDCCYDQSDYGREEEEEEVRMRSFNKNKNKKRNKSKKQTNGYQLNTNSTSSSTSYERGIPEESYNNLSFDHQNNEDESSSFLNQPPTITNNNNNNDVVGCRRRSGKRGKVALVGFSQVSVLFIRRKDHIDELIFVCRGQLKYLLVSPSSLIYKNM